MWKNSTFLQVAATFMGKNESIDLLVHQVSVRLEEAATVKQLVEKEVFFRGRLIDEIIVCS